METAPVARRGRFKVPQFPAKEIHPETEKTMTVVGNSREPRKHKVLRVSQPNRHKGGVFRVGPFDTQESGKAWLKAVIFGGNLSPIGQHLALALHAHKSGPDGTTVAGIQSLTGWSKTVVRNALDELQSLGFIAGHAVTCSYCSAWIEGTACHSDHVVAKTLGGPDDESNRVPVCKSCNSRKSNKPFLAWIIELGGAP